MSEYHVLRKTCIVRNYLVFPKQHVVTRKALVLHVCLSLQPQTRTHRRVFSRKYMSEYHVLRKSRIVRNYLVFPKQHVVTRKDLVLCVCLNVQPQKRTDRRIFSRQNMSEYHVLSKCRIVRNYLFFPKQHVVPRKALVLRACLSVQPQKIMHRRVLSHRICKNTTLQGNTVLQSKDKYVLIGNTVGEEITHHKKLSLYLLNNRL